MILHKLFEFHPNNLDIFRVNLNFNKLEKHVLYIFQEQIYYIFKILQTKKNQKLSKNKTLYAYFYKNKKDEHRP